MRDHHSGGCTRVSCPLPTDIPQTREGRPPRPPTAVQRVGRNQIQVPDQHIGRHASACFAAHAGGSTLQSKPPPPKTPNRGRRWWPNESIGRPRRGQSNQRAGARPGLRAHLGPVTWRCSLKCLSTCDDASCCQPRLTLPARCPLVPQVQDELLPPMHAMKEVQIPWFL